MTTKMGTVTLIPCTEKETELETFGVAFLEIKTPSGKVRSYSIDIPTGTINEQTQKVCSKCGNEVENE